MRRAIKNANSSDKDQIDVEQEKDDCWAVVELLEPASVAYVAAPLTTAATAKEMAKMRPKFLFLAMRDRIKFGQSFIVGVRGGRHVCNFLSWVGKPTISRDGRLYHRGINLLRFSG